MSLELLIENCNLQILSYIVAPDTFDSQGQTSGVCNSSQFMAGYISAFMGQAPLRANNYSFDMNAKLFVTFRKHIRNLCGPNPVITPRVLQFILGSGFTTLLLALHSEVGKNSVVHRAFVLHPLSASQCLTLIREFYGDHDEIDTYTRAVQQQQQATKVLGLFKNRLTSTKANNNFADNTTSDSDESS